MQCNLTCTIWYKYVVFKWKIDLVLKLFFFSFFKEKFNWMKMWHAHKRRPIYVRSLCRTEIKWAVSAKNQFIISPNTKITDKRKIFNQSICATPFASVIHLSWFDLSHTHTHTQLHHRPDKSLTQAFIFTHLYLPLKFLLLLSIISSIVALVSSSGSQ